MRGGLRISGGKGEDVVVGLGATRDGAPVPIVEGDRESVAGLKRDDKAEVPPVIFFVEDSNAKASVHAGIDRGGSRGQVEWDPSAAGSEVDAAELRALAHVLITVSSDGGP